MTQLPPTSSAISRPREIWTRLTVDPLADPLARALARMPGVTPNRVTAVAFVFGLGTAGCFATGHLGWGGALFLLRFFTDCLDGKVARLQHTATSRGALLDVAVDVISVTLAAVTLTAWLVDAKLLSPLVGGTLVGTLVVYNWALAQRKHIAAAAGKGTGGSAHAWNTSMPVISTWVSWCRRLNMSVAPWVLEAEIFTFGLAPLFIPAHRLKVVVILAIAFFLLAILVNFFRLWRLVEPEVTPAAAAGLAPLSTSVEDQSWKNRPWPSVDVVIATRNRPELLRRAVDGVLAQEYGGTITIHVVFDQTTPDPGFVTAETMTRAGRYVRILTNQRVPGLAGARNSGILAGHGDLVGFCDDDDLWLPNKLRLQVEALFASDAATSVTGIVVDYGDRSVPRVPRPEDLTLQRLVRHRVMEAHPSTVLVRRTDLLGGIGLVDEAIPGSYGEDFDWIIRAARHGPITVVPQALVRVLWGQSMFSRNWQTIIDAIDYGIAKTPEFSDDSLALGRLYGRRAFALSALGNGGALTAVIRTLRIAPREKRAYLAAAVALHLVSADRLMDLAHRRGRGI